MDIAVEKKLQDILENSKTVTAVAEELQVSRQTIHKWLRKYKRTHTAPASQVALSHAAHNKIGEETEARIIKLAEKYPKDSVTTLSTRLAYEDGVTVNPATIFRVLKRNNVRYTPSIKEIPLAGKIEKMPVLASVQTIASLPLTQLANVSTSIPLSHPVASQAAFSLMHNVLHKGMSLALLAAGMLFVIFGSHPVAKQASLALSPAPVEEAATPSFSGYANILSIGTPEGVSSMVRPLVLSPSTFSMRNLTKELSSLTHTAPRLRGFALLPIETYRDFALGSYTVGAVDNEVEASPKRTISFLDRVSLSVFCGLRSITGSVNESRCDYDTVVRGGSGPTLVLGYPVVKTEELPVLVSTSTSVVTPPSSGITLPQTPIIQYISNYITKYVAVPGPRGEDGKDGKDGESGTNGVSTFNNQQSQFGFGSYTLPSVSTPSSPIGISTIGYLRETTIEKPFVSDGLFSGTNIFNNTLIANNFIATSSSFFNVTTANATSTNSYITNLFASAATTTDSYVSRLVAASSTLTDALLTNSTSTNAYVASLVAASSTLTDLIVTNATVTGLIASSSTLTNLIATNATTTSLYTDSLTVGSSTAGDMLLNGTLTVRGTSTLATTTLTSLSAEKFVVDQATSTSFFTSLFSAITGYFTNLESTNATTTNFSATNGFLTNASTTNLFTQNLAVGNASTTGNQTIDGSLNVSGTSTLGANVYLNGNVVVGSSTNEMFTVNALVNSNITPAANKVYDLGSPSFYWRNLYADNINVNSISAASTTISGTSNNDFTINSDNNSSDTEDVSLVFFRGLVTPNALFRWNATNKRLETNQSFKIQNETPSTGTTTLTVQSGAGQGSTNLFELLNNAGTKLSAFNANGWLGIGSTTPGSALSVVGNAYVGGNVTATGTLNVTGQTTLTTASSTGLTTTNLYGTNSVITNATSTNLFTSVLNAITAAFTTLTTTGTTTLATNGGAVAINTTIPVAGNSLTVNGSAYVSSSIYGGSGLFTSAGNVIGLSGPNDFTSYIYSPTGTEIALRANNAERLRIASNGNVGIGTTTPGSLFSVQGNTYIGGSITATGTLTLTSLTQGSIPFIGAGGQVSQDAGELFWDPTNNRLGIGTSTVFGAQNSGPSLSIYNSSSGFNPAGVRMTNSDTGNTATDGFAVNVDNAEQGRLWNFENTAMVFATNNLQRMTIDASGNVGIGTTTPGSMLQVAGDARLGVGGTTAGQLILQNASNLFTTTIRSSSTQAMNLTFTLPNSTGTPDFALKTDGAGNLFWGAAGGVTDGQNGYVVRYTGANSTATGTLLDNGIVAGVNATSSSYSFNVQGTSGVNPFNVASSTGASLFSILQNGNVGIGTTNPGALLHVLKSGTGVTGGAIIQGGDTASTGNVGQLVIRSIGGGGGNVDATLKSYYTGSQYAFSADTGNSSYPILLNAISGGNVGIGTTTPNSPLTIYGAGNYGQMDIVSSAANGETGLLFKSADDSDSTGWLIGKNVGLTDDSFSIFRGGNLFTINTNGNVGIGTTTASDKLTVAGNISIPYGGSLKTNGTNGVVAYNNIIATGWNGAQDFTSLYTAGSGNANPIMTLLHTGNVGIGTTTPGALLHINSTVTTTATIGQKDARILLQNNTGTVDAGGEITFAYLDAANSRYASIGSGALANAGASGGVGYLNFSTKTNVGDTVLSERMRITNTGNVGIGTTNPGTRLQVSSAGTASGETVAAFLNGTTTAPYATGKIGIGDGSTIRGIIQVQKNNVSSGGMMIFSTEDTGAVLQDRMVIDKSGNVGIGTITPGAKLHVDGGAFLLTNSGQAAATIRSISSAGSAVFPQLSIENFSNNNGFPVIELIQSRGTSTSPLSVIAGDILGGFNTWGNNGTGPLSATRIQGLAETTFSSSVGAALQFFTTTGGSQSEKMRITGSGSIGIGTTTPQTLLHLSSATPSSGGILVESTGAFGGGVADIEVRGRRDDSNGSTPFGGSLYLSRLYGVGDMSPGPNNTFSQLGNILFGGNAGGSTASSIVYPASIGGIVEGVFTSSTTANTGLAFRTGAIGSAKDTPNVEFGTERMRITSTGNVGIGTTTPGSKLTLTGGNLEVNGSTAPGVLLRPTSGSSYVVGANTAITGVGIYDNIAGAWRLMVQDTTGNIGIGTTTPVTRLHVAKGASGVAPVAGSQLTVESNGNNFLSLLTPSLNSSGVTFGNVLSAADGGVYYNAVTARGIDFRTAGNSAKMVIDAFGKIGIGTTTPGATLSLQGVAGVNPFNVASSTGASLFSILQNGNVGIGTSNPSARLSIQPATDVPQLRLFQNNTDTAGYTLWNTSNGGDLIFSRYSSSADIERVRFTAAGNVLIGATTSIEKLTLDSTSQNALKFEETGISRAWVGISAGTGGILPGSLNNDLAIRSENHLLLGAGGYNTNLYLSAGGNVGIGTTTLGTYTLTVANATGAAPYFQAVRNSSASQDFIIGAFGITSIRGAAVNSASLSVNTGATNVPGIVVKGAGGQAADLQQWLNSSNTVLANITATGNVGIGTSSPTAKLDVYGNLNVGTSSTPTLFVNTGTGNVGIGTNNPLQALSVVGAGYISAWGVGTVAANNVSILRVDGAAGSSSATFINGNVGIGTTTPGSLLTVQGAIYALSAYVDTLSARVASFTSLALGAATDKVTNALLSLNVATTGTELVTKNSAAGFTVSGYATTTGVALNAANQGGGITLLLASTTSIGNGVMTAGPSLASGTLDDGGHAILRPDGKYLVVNGNGTAVTNIYDPVANTFAAGPSLSSGTVQHGGHSFQRPDGKFLLINANNTAVTNIYDPVANTFSTGPSFASGVANFGSHAIQRPDGKFLVINASISATTNIYDPVANSFAAGPSLATGSAYAGSHSIQRPDGKFLVINGNNTATTNIYDPIANTFVAGPTLASGTAFTGSHSIQRPDGKFLVINGNFTTVTNIYDPVANTFVVGPSLSSVVNHGAYSIQRPDGKWLIVVAGTSSATEVYDPTTNTFSAGPTLASGAAFNGGFAIQRPDGKFLIVNGNVSATTNIYDPSYIMTGSWESEDMNMTDLNQSSLLNYTTNGEGKIEVAIKTATSSAALAASYTVYATTTSGLKILPVSGATYAKVKVTFTRPIPTYRQPMVNAKEKNVWLGESDTKYQRTFAMPTLYSLSINNQKGYHITNTDFGTNNASTTLTSNATSGPIISNLLIGENGLTLPYTLDIPDFSAAGDDKGSLVQSTSTPVNISTGAFTLQRPDGKFLLVVGNSSSATYIYDPSTSSYINGPTLTNTIGSGAHAFQRPDGKFLIVLGNSWNITNIYDPVANTVAAGPNLTSNAAGGSNAIQRPDGKFLIYRGGTTGTDIYDPITNTISVGPTIGTSIGMGSLSIPRPDGKFFVTPGGSAGPSYTYDPISNTFLSNGYSLTTDYGATAIQRPDGKWYILLGGTTATAVQYDPFSNTYISAPGGAYTNAYYGNNAIQRPDGKFLIFANSTTWLYDPFSSSGNTTVGPSQASFYHGAHSFQRPDGKFVSYLGSGDQRSFVYDAGWITRGAYESEFINDSTLDSNSVLTWKGNADAYKSGVLSVRVRTATSSNALQVASWRTLPVSGSRINPGTGETWMQARFEMNRNISSVTQAGSIKNVFQSDGANIVFNRLPLNPSAGYANQAQTFVKPTIYSYAIQKQEGQDLATFSVNGNNAFRFSATGDAYTSAGGSWNAGGADVAEYFPTEDGLLEPGDIVSVSQDARGLVAMTTESYDDTILGIVTTAPGLRLGSDEIGANQGKQPIALAGRVPVKVSLENGVIKKGDYLTSSSRPGFAMKALDTGRVIGIALEDYTLQNDTDNNGAGKVLTFVNPHFYMGATFTEKVTSTFSRFATMIQKGISELGVTIQENGNVGIGVTDPLSRLHVAGDARLGVASTTSGRLLFQNEANDFITTIRSATSTLESDVTFTLPSSLGSARQAMLTDGTGTLYFGSVPLISSNASSTAGYAVRWLPDGEVASGVLMDDGYVSGVNATSSSAFTVAQATSTQNAFSILSSMRDTFFAVDATGLVSVGTSTAGSRFDIFDATEEPEADLFRVVSNVGGTSNVKLKVNARGDLFAKSSISIGLGASIAENYTALEAIDAGTVVAFGTTTSSWIQMTATTTEDYAIAGVRKAMNDREAVGVVSTKSGLTLATSTTNGIPVAFVGRVPVKVTTENGEIKAGDYLTVSSSTPGYAMKLTGEGRALGRAVSDYMEGRDKVMMVIENRDVMLDITGSFSTTTKMLTTGNIDLNANAVAIVNIKSLASANGTWSIDENGKITAKSICIDGNCVDGQGLGDIIATSKRTGAMQVVGNYAYLLNAKTRSLRVLDMTNQENPVIVTTLGMEEGVSTIVAAGNLLYISNDDTSKLYIVDISNPTNPVVTKSLDTTGTAIADLPVIPEEGAPNQDPGMSTPEGEVAGVSTSTEPDTLPEEVVTIVPFVEAPALEVPDVSPVAEIDTPPTETPTE